MDKQHLPADPRGLIYESYRIEGINAVECRSIFFDWAVGMPEGSDLEVHRQALIAEYAAKHPDHPMSAVLQESLPGSAGVRRRGGRRGNPRVGD